MSWLRYHLRQANIVRRSSSKLRSKYHERKREREKKNNLPKR